MTWIRSNAGWLAALLTLIGAGSTAYLALYVRAAQAEPNARITALETHRSHDAADLADIKRKLESIETKIDRLAERIP